MQSVEDTTTVTSNRAQLAPTSNHAQLAPVRGTPADMQEIKALLDPPLSPSWEPGCHVDDVVCTDCNSCCVVAKSAWCIFVASCYTDVHDPDVISKSGNETLAGTKAQSSCSYKQLCSVGMESSKHVISLALNICQVQSAIMSLSACV